jgi:YVTN family beta-propeller protein
VIDPESNEIVDEVQVGQRPGPLAFGGGKVWVGNLDGHSLSTIDARTRAAGGDIDLDGRTPTGVAFGDDVVWVAHGALGQLSRLDPEFPGPSPPIQVADQAQGTINGSVTYGLGAAWTVFGDSTLARIDPDTKAVRRGTAGADPAGIVVRGDDVWVVNTAGANVQQFDPQTFQDFAVASANTGRRPIAIAEGEGAVWVANGEEDSVTVVDPGTPLSTETIQSVGDEPTAIAVGAGSVWVANMGDRTVSRIDPGTRRVVETIETGNPPAGITFGGGYIWVSVEAP